MLMQPGRRNVWAALGVVAVLGGCADTPDFAAYDFRLRHPVTVDAVTASLTLGASAGDAVLAAEESNRLDRFVADYERRGEGVIDVSVAAAGPDDRAAAAYGRTLVGELARRGVGADKVGLRLMAAAPGQPRAQLTYRQYVARLPECGVFSSSTTFDAANAQTPNFGCAIERNIGLMVANPRDLDRMRPADEVEAARSSDVLAKYRRGEATGSAGKVETTVISGPK